MGPVLVLACGFCTPGPTAYLLPFLPVWAAVFVLWCLFRLKYDVGPKRDSMKWILTAVLLFVLGPIFTISMWSIFLLFWTFYVFHRLLLLLSKTKPMERKETSDTIKHPTAKVRIQAAWFHGHILGFLAVGLSAKVVLIFFS